MNHLPPFEKNGEEIQVEWRVTQEPRLELVSIEYPVRYPKDKHPVGGHLLRRSRLKKKRRKYLIRIGRIYQFYAYVSMNGDGTVTVTPVTTPDIAMNFYCLTTK